MTYQILIHGTGYRYYLLDHSSRNIIYLGDANQTLEYLQKDLIDQSEQQRLQSWLVTQQQNEQLATPDPLVFLEALKFSALLLADPCTGTLLGVTVAFVREMAQQVLGLAEYDLGRITHRQALDAIINVLPDSAFRTAAATSPLVVNTKAAKISTSLEQAYVPTPVSTLLRNRNATNMRFRP